MPQTMCSLCVDKVNDFYEFREMCYATNAQTRKLLGLKTIKKPEKKVVDIKPETKKLTIQKPVDIKPESKKLDLRRAADMKVDNKKLDLRKAAEVKPKVEAKEPPKETKEVKEEKEEAVISRNALRKRKSDECSALKKENALPVVSNKKLRLAATAAPKEAPVKKVSFGKPKAAAKPPPPEPVPEVVKEEM